jgi:hypothetical protein
VVKSGVLGGGATGDVKGESRTQPSPPGGQALAALDDGGDVIPIVRHTHHPLPTPSCLNPTTHEHWEGVFQVRHTIGRCLTLSGVCMQEVAGSRREEDVRQKWMSVREEWDR